MSTIAIRATVVTASLRCYATQTDKGHKPDGCSDKKHGKKKKSCSHAAQLSRSNAGRHKRRTETQSSQQAQRCRTGHAAFSVTPMFTSSEPEHD